MCVSAGPALVDGVVCVVCAVLTVTVCLCSVCTAGAGLFEAKVHMPDCAM